MSGTSLDGIDLAEIDFNVSKYGEWNYTILKSETIKYPNNWKSYLQNAISKSNDQVAKLNRDYTQFLAKIINEFIVSNHILNLDAVCSHGHTIWHQPKKGFTLQIGNLPEIASMINQNVVCDFRVQDLDLGGNGAPLVPIGDRLLFNEFDYCLNLGGFANISFEEKKGNKNELLRIAYDVCPVNIALNYLAEKLGHSYDHNGDIAKKGIVSEELLYKLNELSFYKLSPPKSLGLEWVKKHVFPLLEKSNISVIDQISTVTEHIAFQLVNQFKVDSKILITGGGTFNLFLLERMNSLKKINLVLPSSKLIEYKEALIFGLLGVLKLRNENNCLKSVTGAIKDHSSGEIFRIK
jgi:anhydro-N-acetylmuramic acid kinase